MLSACSSLPQSRKHDYEDVQFGHPGHAYEDVNTFPASMPNPPSPLNIMDRFKRSESAVSMPARSAADRFKQKQGLKSSTVVNVRSQGSKVK